MGRRAMDLRRRILFGAVSAAALACAGAPAMAAEGPSSVEEVVVTGIRESLERAIEIKRQNENQVDAISAEDIGKLPDKNVADALQRIPGVNTTSAASGEGGFDENDRVSIRGTSPSLTQVTVDGHAVSTGDWFVLDQFQTVGRSISFTLLPAEIVQSTLVYKTQDASLLEGGVSGAVNILTRQPLSFKQPLSFQGSVQGAWNSQSKENKPQASGLVAWNNDAGTFGALLQGFYEERSVRRYGQEVLGYSPIGAGSATGTAHPDLVGVMAPNLIGSTLFEQTRKRKGGDFALQWRPSDKFEARLSGFYSKLGADNVNYNYMFWGTREVANNIPTTYTVRDNTLVAASYPLNNPVTGAPVEGLVVDNIIRPNASAESYYLNLDGEWHVSDRLTLKGQVGYTKGKGDTPEQPAYEVDGFTGISYQPSGNGFAVTPTNINPQSPAGLSNDWGWNVVFHTVDDEKYAKVDGSWDLDNGPFKALEFGARISDHKRDVQGWDRGCTIGANGQCWSSPTQPWSAVGPLTSYGGGINDIGIPGILVPIHADPNAIINVFNHISDGVHGPASAIVQPQNYYWPSTFTVKEKDYAGYVLTRVGGEGWRGNFGLRVVDTKLDSYVNVSAAGAPANTPGLVTSSAYGPFIVTKVSHDYVDVLPSANFTFDVNDKMAIRISAAETISRPDYSALAGTVSLTDSIHTGSGGNPDLKPIKAAVYDAAFEWYYAPASLAAVSLFYNDISSYVTYGIHNATYLDAQATGQGATPVFANYIITSPINTSGTVKGVEFQIQQPLPMHFGFLANLTYLEGEDADGGPLVGASRVTYNVVGYYENNRLSARLAYTYRSHFLVGLDRSAAENQDSYGQLDGSINFRVTDNISLNLDALNLTDEILKYYGDNKTQPRAAYKNGTQVFFGIRAKF